tara:strand:- start:366 stop:554 length:189 start_codon:yes stop_codon:yes gene_type:complete
MKITKKNNKRIDHVQKGLKADQKVNGTKRPLNEFTELCMLIGDQFDDDTFSIKQEKICLNQI